MWYVNKVWLMGIILRCILGRKCTAVSGSYQVNAGHLGLEKTNFITDIT